MGVKISEMTADSAVGGSEKIPVLDGSSNYTITTDQMAAYAIDELISAASATPGGGDYLLGYRGTDEKSFAIGDVSTYALTYVYNVSGAANPAVTGDLLVVNRSGTLYQMNVDTLKTYARVNIQADTLGAYVFSLTTATLGSTDQFTVVQGTTPKKTTLSALETKLWADYATYVTGLDAASSAADANVLYVLQSGNPKKLALSDLAAYIEDEIDTAGTLSTSVLGDLATYVAALDPVTTVASTDKFYTIQSATEKYVTAEDIADYVVGEAQELPWKLVADSKYKATPASTSTVTMSDSSDFKVGYPVKYTDTDGTYYGIVTAVNASLLTIAGPTLSVAKDILELRVGRPERVIPATFFVDGVYGDAVQDMFADVTKSRYRWSMANAYIVRFSAAHDTVDTGASQPVVNIKAGGDLVATTGVALSGTAGTWVDNGAVDVSSTHYAVATGDAIDIRVTTAGTTGDAENLTVNIVFVLE